MVRVTEELALSAEHLTLYHAADPLLGHLPVLIFHGHSTTANYTLNSSRVQIHVYSPAGFQSFPRLTIQPNSPFYAVVNHLPREWQGDEIYRGLAFGLYKYFQELPEVVKNHLKNTYPTTRGRRPGSGPALFGEQHAADLAKNMIKSENTVEVLETLQTALQTQHLSNVDIDFVLPPGSIVPLQPEDLEEVPEDEDDILDPTLRQYGGYSSLVKLLGEPVFLPTSRLRRAPSKPTSLNRSKSFSKDQKVELRMKLGELVDTEERYVLKLNELVKHIADEFRQSARQRDASSLSPSEDELEKLFPISADKILQVNSAFMQELRKIMDDTEDEALKDMETTTVALTGSRLGSPSKAKDPSGALAIARIFLEWFPKFTDCYQDYIRASQHFPTLLNSFLDEQSSFRQRVIQKGEQTVRSILIEPVQRLPRYSLLIDQIVQCLPMTHPALQPMLKARDIITNICSMDDPVPEKPHVTGRLRNLVESWPLDLEPVGRLVLAADFVELPAPYRLLDPPQMSERAGIFLLFSDCLVILKKLGPKPMCGRDLLREIDKPSAAGLLMSMTNAAGGQASYELAFTGWHSLSDVRFSESADGTLIWMTSTQEMKGAHAGEWVTGTAVTSRCFLLEESFEAKGSKWTEDIVKARVEGRFSEKEREDPSWSLRSFRLPDNNLGVFAAVFQEGADQLIEGRREPAPIRIVIDHEKGTKGAPIGHYGVEITVNVRSGDLKKVNMQTAGLNGRQFADDVALDDFLPTLTRRVIQLLSLQFNASNLRLAPALVSYYTKILKGLPLMTRAEKTRSFLASSPVKGLFSSIWGGSTNTEAHSPPKHNRTPVTNLFPPPPVSRANSDQGSVFGSARGKDGIKMAGDDRPENPLVRLEQTFTGYVASLQNRKGSIVGRMLLNRSVADELSVNDLYNRLIESPFDLDASSELGADVIFVAFEKFIRIAWCEQMGPIMTKQALDTLLERMNRQVPGNFADFVNFMFKDMAPQNQRAFTALIKLLADLLDGCGNDGDRGILTVSFAELLVHDGTAQNYINLLDRLVEDCDRIFDEPGGIHLTVQQAFESMNSRSGKSHTGSLTSNTSSIRRKFGFDTLLRQNSKNDSERPSVWRTLSKHGRHPASADAASSSSLSKMTSARARSIDSGTGTQPGPNKLRRPGSRDRPPIAGAFDEDPRPPSSQRLDMRLETIGEPEVETPPTKSSKKKRRSSLSDLRSLMEAATIVDPQEKIEEALMPLRINKQTSEKFNSTPRIPSPSRIPISPTSSSLRSPRMISPRLKENPASPDPLQILHTPRTPHTPGVLDRENTPSRTPKGHGRGLSTSNIPTLRPARPTTGSHSSDAIPRPSTSPGKPPGTGKLRLQSPQKLRERLQTEKKAVEDVDASLKSELSKIAEEMSRVNSGLGGRTDTLDLRKLTDSVKTLEERIPNMMTELTERQTSIQRDMESTLKASETKVKSIDQLYREATAENELMYEKFNSELGKIVKALKGKGREDKEDLLRSLREHSEETARVKKENARLKREIVSLRTLMKGADA
ncbi:Rho guanine nucleotide exchange factor gef2 [Colletotrichum siamense]|uniref:Rho guanine nucleotide exchange factor gef2 n=1 Tax=Colletotrichum siamense TaxID=690259 RepID=A0A9P5ES72_COLSI|nr:Rho guanine nucleotide exchange factor gef2 [Colletotrichum siamense]KAF4858922.1 Rho guanine nucleotide exchange factor gef2 [Colletotrichum siamense]